MVLGGGAMLGTLGQDAARFVGFPGCGRGFRNKGSLMWKAVIGIVALSLFTVQAEARPWHHRHYYRHQLLQSMAPVAGDERIISSRPSGCPRAYCGCEASLFRFGRIIPQLNLASNWRRFPRAAPGPGMAAVRSGHVMILQQYVGGDIWYVHDGNSGGRATREYPRSIAGYTIVDPGSASIAPGSSVQGGLADQFVCPACRSPFDLIAEFLPGAVPTHLFRSAKVSTRAE